MNIEVKKIVTVGNCKLLNLRARPHKDAKIITMLPEGTCLKIFSKPNDNWVGVESAEFGKGYVMTKYCKE